MKRHLVKLLVVFGVLALAAQAQALAIDPLTSYIDYQGNEQSQNLINGIIAPYIAPSTLLYSASPGGGEEGSLATSYTTGFSDTSTDPSGATITYGGVGDIVGPTAWLLVKDGAQEPAWYLFNLTDAPAPDGWNGTDPLVLSGFWPNQGAISHVSLYGGTTSVPEPGTLLLLGGGLVGLALYGRKTFKR